MDVDVIDKASGKVVHLSGNSIVLDDPSIVRLDLDRIKIASLERQGNDLVVHFADGETLRLGNFYLMENGTSSDLVVREPDTGLWMADKAAQGPARFTPLHGLDELLAAAGEGAASGGGGGALLPVLLGVAGAGGLAAALGGGGGSGRRNSDGPGTQADTTPPAAPTAAMSGDGRNVTGTGEAGATVQIRDASGTVIGTGSVGANGSYSIPLTQPQTNGQNVTVTQTDAAGNASPPTTATAPDITAPAAPSATVAPDGTAVTGTGEPGATVRVTDANGQPVGTAVVGADGTYTVPLAPGQANGGALNVVQTDAAGNASPPTVVTTPDLAAPDAPSATVAPDGTAVTGTGEPGATVTVTDADGTTLGTGTVAADGSYAIPLVPPRIDGGSLDVSQTDAAGNTSPATIIATPDLVAPDAPTATVAPDGSAVTGTGEPGATVQVTDGNGQPVGTTIVAPDGTYTVPLPPGRADGGDLNVTQTDPAGNASPATTVTTPDLTAPDAPTATVAADGSAVTGTGEPGATVTVTDADGAPLGTAIVAADGSYTVPLSPGVADGSQITVVQSDAAGNVSPETMATTPDLVAPTAPTATVAADGASVTGTGEPGATVTITDAGGAPLGTATVAADGSYFVALAPAQANGQTLRVTQSDVAGNDSPSVSVTAPDVTPPAAPAASISANGATVTGTGEAGATVTVRDAAGNPLGTAIVAADGSFTATLSSPQVNGQALRVSQADPAGNVSPAIQVSAPDTTAPLGLTAAVDGSGTIVSGHGEAGAAVTVRDPAGTVIGTATVAQDGSYTVTLTTPQTNAQVLQVTQADAAGNPSTPVPATAPDLTAPAAPAGTVSADGTVVTGNGEAGATLTVRDAGGTVIGTATVAADGSYAVTLTAPQANGQTLQLTQADAAGNVSPATPVVAPDITAPLGLTAAVDPAGTVVRGSGEAGATVTVRDPLGTVIGTGMVAANGSYAVVLNTPQTNAQVLQVTQADAAGNPSTPVPATAPDLTAPIAPTGTVSTDGLMVTGTGEAGATVTVRNAAGTAIGTATVAGDGSYAVTLAPPQTNGEVLSIRQADPAGNVSPAIPATAPDITAPIGLTAAVNGTGTIVSGSGEAGATVTVRDPLGTVVGTAVVAANGAYAVVLTTPQANGETLQVMQTDAAGNPSVPVPALAPDITAPAAPTLAISADGATASGTGEAGATVTITTSSGAVIGTALVAGDSSYTATLTLAQANGETVRATQADGAGNVSPVTSTLAPDITPPAAPAATLDVTGSVVSGTGEPGAMVTVRDPFSTVIGSGTVDAQGNFSIALTPPQVDSQILSVVQADAAGNPSPAAMLTAPDLTAPAAPIGTVAADGASIAGIGEAGAVLTITDPVGVPIGTVVVAGDGTFLTTLTPPQVNGEVLGLTQVDAAGNVSPEGSAVAPDLVLNDSPGAPTATVAADGATVFGTGDPGNTITVRGANGVSLGTAVVNGGGTYVVVLTTPQLNGETVRVTQTDAELDTSPPATAVAPDLTPPAAPTAAIDATGLVVTGTGEAGATVRVADAGGTVLGTATVNPNGSYAVILTTAQLNGQALAVTQVDGASNVSPPAPVTAPDVTAPTAPTASVSADGATVTGTGEAGATVTITDASGATIGTAVVTGGGTYAATLTPPQLNGERLTAVQADAAGNVSPPATATAPDATPPAAPTATVDPSGTIVTGTGEAGATITIRDPLGTPIATAVVGANGGYTATLPAAQVNGQVLQVTQADAAGNVSPPTAATAPDLVAPNAPTGTVSPDGTTVTGTGEAGATVTIRDAGGTAIGTALVAGDGSYTATLTPAQTNGQVLTVGQADPAGNLSPSISANAPDITAPSAPTATVSANGTTVVGTGEAGATVTVRDPAGNAIGTAVVASNGAYTVVLTTPQANGQTLQVAQADSAGNLSPSTAALAPDITAPAAPTAAVSADGTAVTGVGEAGATVHITNAAGVEIGTAIVAGNGTYSATLTTPQANGETLGVTQADAAGNISPVTTATAPDITPPALPSGVAINGEGTVVTGTGEAGATVEVRDAGGTLLGTATVAANGSFAVTLNDPQTAGEALGVLQRDPAGNASGAVPIVAPFDIDAFDNAASASIDLVPTTTNENLGTANYLALVSLGLLNLDVQVLAVPNVQFSVDAGHTLDATFTYDATLNIGVLSGYSVVIQRFDGTNWVALDGPDNHTLLQLGLLNGNLVATETLGPGEYRAFVTFDGALGVGLLGGLNVGGVDSDYTDVAAVVPGTTTGNVMTDPGAGGEVDLASPQTVVQSVTIGGVTTQVTADGTVIDGAWGTLVIDRDGSYTYTPDANAAAIGHVDTFTYTLIDGSDGELESATLTITIGSPDVTGAPLAVNDVAVAEATFENVVTTSPAAVDSSFVTPTAIVLTGAQTGTVHDSFTVGPNSTADVTLSAIRQGGLSVLPTYTITVTDSHGVVVGTLTQTALAGLPLGSGVSLTLQDLPSGTYSYTVSSTNLLGTGYGTSVYVGQTVTHLDQHALTGTAPVEGSLLDNDTLGSAFVTVRMQSGGNFVEVGDTPLTIVGAHGTLTVTEAGEYSYQPSASLTYSGGDPVDSFSYQIVQPDGQVATARLDVAVDINNGVAPTMVVDDPGMTSALVDAVPLAMLMSEPDMASMSAPTHGPLAFDLVDARDTVEDMLGRFLDDRQTGSGTQETAAATSVEPAPTEIAALPAVDDPLGYLVSPGDVDHDRFAALHMV